MWQPSKHVARCVSRPEGCSSRIAAQRGTSSSRCARPSGAPGPRSATLGRFGRTGALPRRRAGLWLRRRHAAAPTSTSSTAARASGHARSWVRARGGGGGRHAKSPKPLPAHVTHVRRMNKTCFKNFEIRQTARDEEVEALRQAKAILSGAKFEAFLQGA